MPATATALRRAVTNPPPGPSFEARVSARARAFGLKSLIDLLLRHGYGREQMLFQGNPEGGASSLIQAIEFRPGSGANVIITVNLGLLGDNSLLPSYFVREVERSANPERFYDFIRFFDHRLIENYLAAVWPEDDPHVYGDYGFVQRAFVKLAGFSSVSSLHWFVQTVFPELRVRVQRGAFATATSSHACRTGQARLDGSTVIGRVYESELQGFRVDLITDEEVDDRGRSWATVLRERLSQRLLPVLAPFRIPLAVVLVVLTHASWAELEDGKRQTRGYLGYDRIRGEAEAGHSVLLWSGVAGANAERESEG